MSKLRKLVGLWIVLAVYLAIFPVIFYLLSRWLDELFGLPPILPAETNVFAAALAWLIGIFWASWGYSYLHFVGAGSPVEAFGRALYPTEQLVTSGPYAYTRNPMLLGLLFLLLGLAFYFRSIGGLILVPILSILALMYIKLFEEPELMRRFGGAYVQYRHTVPALLPRLW
jgi:protein-S-isoprenylcysteine O-methyltransferase Ste14